MRWWIYNAAFVVFEHLGALSYWRHWDMSQRLW